MPHNMFICAYTVSDSVEDDQRKLAEARELLGPDWIVAEGETHDAPAA